MCLMGSVGRHCCAVRVVVVVGRRTELMAGRFWKKVATFIILLFFFRLSFLARALFFRLGRSSFSFFPFFLFSFFPFFLFSFFPFFLFSFFPFFLFFSFFDGVVIYVPVWLHLDLPP